MKCFIETNRARASAQRVVAFLKSKGIDATRLLHKTTFKVTKPKNMTIGEFKDCLLKIIDPRLGSMIIFIEPRGETYLVDNRGNRRGRFIRQ